MIEIKRLILRIFQLLELIETKRNQPTVQKIRGLLFEILNEVDEV